MMPVTRKTVCDTVSACVVVMALTALVACEKKPPAHVEMTAASYELVHSLRSVEAFADGKSDYSDIQFGVMPERPVRSIVVDLNSSFKLEPLEKILREEIAALTEEPVVVFLVNHGNEIGRLHVGNGAGPDLGVESRK